MKRNHYFKISNIRIAALLAAVLMAYACVHACYAVQNDPDAEEEHSGYTITVVEDDTDQALIEDGNVPLAATPLEQNGWGILDLILVIITCVMSAYMLRRRKGSVITAAALIIAAGAVAVLMITSDFDAGMKPCGRDAVILGELFAAELAAILFSEYTSLYGRRN